MADAKISQLTGATTPLAGTEVLPVVQSSTTKKVSVANLTAGRDVAVKKLQPTDNVVFVAGKGADFSATAGSGGATKKVLDWYEEGTWTATLTTDTTPPTTPVTATGRYTLVGRLMFVQVSFSNVNTTGASGIVLVTGLPFTISSVGSYGSCFMIGFTATAPVAYFQPSSNQIAFLEGGTGGYIGMSAGAGKYVSFSGCYTV